MKVWIALATETWQTGDTFIGVAGSKETAQSLTAPNLTWVDSEDGTESVASIGKHYAYVVTEKLVIP